LSVSWSDRFEEHLEDAVLAHRGSSIVADLLSYHFGYGAYGPARRGKRLRPTLVVIAAQTEGCEIEAALDAAVAIEMVHNYSLIHDDIEDRDELRHGRPTLWARSGVPQALNAGDALCALAFLALANAGAHHTPGRVVRMIHALHRAHLTMCDGQSLDLQFEREAHVDLAAYTAMIAGKTAAIFAAAGELGALCAGADDAVASYRALGSAYGLAFQIADDVHGIWADEDATGKQRGVDIARRKWTYPVAWALSGPASAARTVVAEAYGRGEPLDRAEVDRVVDALDGLGAREAARRASAEHLALIERHPKGGVRDFLLRGDSPA